jgi:hypothetical protein
MSDLSRRSPQGQNDRRVYRPPVIEAVKLNTKEVLLGDCYSGTSIVVQSDCAPMGGSSCATS